MKILTPLKRIHQFFSYKISFKDLKRRDFIYLYAGDVPPDEQYKKFIGLSLSQANHNHIKHDVTKKLPLEDSCVDIYQSEDVFEHIEYSFLPEVINEIYRVTAVQNRFLSI